MNYCKIFDYFFLAGKLYFLVDDLKFSKLIFLAQGSRSITRASRGAQWVILAGGKGYTVVYLVVVIVNSVKFVVYYRVLHYSTKLCLFNVHWVISVSGHLATPPPPAPSGGGQKKLRARAVLAGIDIYSGLADS